MNSNSEEDLLLTLKLEYMEAREEESALSCQIKSLKSQKEETTRIFEKQKNNYHLATQVSETYTLDFFDPSLRHDADCMCYVERNEKLQTEAEIELSKIQNELELIQNLHREIIPTFANAKRRFETLRERILKFQNASESHSKNRIKIRRLCNRKYKLQWRIEHEINVKLKTQLEGALDHLKQNISDVQQDFNTSKQELKVSKALLSKYRRYLQGIIDTRGRMTQTTNPKVFDLESALAL